jgi:hypothetical protein
MFKLSRVENIWLAICTGLIVGCALLFLCEDAEAQMTLPVIPSCAASSGWLCGEGAIQYRIHIGGDLWWNWPWVTQPGGCLEVNELLYDAAYDGRLEWRCIFTDGTPPTEYRGVAGGCE